MVKARVLTAQGDLTSGDARVLVNASNTQLDLGSGVSQAIFRACGGEDFQKAIHARLRAERVGPLQPGDVFITDAGSHPRARWVAHVAVMDYRAGTPPEKVGPTLERVAGACAELWEALEAESLEGDASLTVAMVALGAGVGGLRVRDSVGVACDTLKCHLAPRAQSQIAQVTFYGFTSEQHAEVSAEVLRHFPEAPPPA